ncbi:glycerophosphodiester phosphodiesterase family protein [Pseudoruegeria sp. HB172150]|uniref:glycerophosphodiester phosphodiesterase family protein n=1 Tax=Pseudoruegeria sp. HB172150 TaxID=2721164 RepID=UPI00155199E7|nr:glycerophosphodiester phosphodiesterase family protein [Pseudoruegeria sp. HB172150]
MHRREFLAAAAAASVFAPKVLTAQEKLFIKQFDSAEALAAYSRLSALQVSQPLLMAHRAGYSPQGGLPECSIPSAELVIRTGPAMIEIDVRRTSDGAMVCLHDSTLDRETTGTGEVKDVTLAEFKALKLRDANGDPTEIGPSTFEEFLAWGENGALLWLDTKDVDPATLVAMIRDHAAEARVIVSAYGRETLDKYMAEDAGLVHFVPLIPALDLPDLPSVLATGLPASHMIGFAGWYVPNLRGSLDMAEADIPALLDLGRADQRLTPDAMDPMLYENAVKEGFPMMNTDQYARVLEILGITDWA